MKKNQKYIHLIDQVKKIRARNNVNWMNILKLAFKYAPDQARSIVSKINTDDNKISDLLKKLSENK